MQTIIQNPFILKYYSFETIESPIISKIDCCSFFGDRKEGFKRILSAFLFITEQNIKFLDLSSVKFKNFIDGFYFFLSKNYINLSSEFLEKLRYDLSNWIKFLKEEIPALKNYEINKNKNNLDFVFNQEKINYIQGWILEDKENKSQIFINLIIFYPILGAEKINLLYKNIQQYTSKYRLRTSRQFFSMLNGFSIFLETKSSTELKIILNSSNSIYDLMKEFCFVFFTNEQNTEKVLHSSKRKWNKFIEVFENTFLDGKILPKLSCELPKIANNKRNGFETRIKIENGVEIKSKLITEIPLNITDEIALEILFKKINSDVELTIGWATKQVEDLLISYNSKFPQECFNQSSKEIKKNLQSNDSLKDIKDTLLTANSLEPFMFLLINEHPQITESFLLKCELYNSDYNKSGYVVHDNNFYLISYKNRRGHELAEQKILLNENSKKIIDNIIMLTENYRDYLKKQNNDDWRYLFLHGGEKGVKPQKYIKTFVPAPSNLKFNEGIKRIDFIMSQKNCSLEEATKFVSNMTMTKLRASKAVQLYLISNDAQKMSEILGHKSYRPELLSHYLPKSILDFFQSRWIRIFQKGIICEAMKDSPYFLKSSNFKTMDELDKFMNLHALKNIPNIQTENKENNNDEIYIGVNEDILSVLLSLEKAVKLAKNEVSPKALYWSKFVIKLENEIINNKTNIQFVKELENARNKINPQIFKDMIYEK